jgi:hypothetical protein
MFKIKTNHLCSFESEGRSCAEINDRIVNIQIEVDPRTCCAGNPVDYED